MPNGLYLATFEAALKNTLALDLSNTDAGRFKLMLVSDTYTPDFSTDSGYADVSAHEVSGTGYTSGGEAVTSVSFSITGGLLVFDADDVTWSSCSVTANGAVLYDTVLAGQPLIAFFDFRESKTSVSSTFTVPFPTDGMFLLDLTP